MADKSEIWVVYDGECPFCSAYVRMVRLRDAAGKVHLLNAREEHPVVAQLKGEGFDLDEGMALKIGDAVYHGDECMHQLALMSGPSGLFNRFHFWVFKSPRRAKFLYPSLRAGRNLALRLLGRRKIDGVGKDALAL
ncbi:MAG: DCC1-like thiol-disulfide oxidoreductase family protein [Pseudomonadota bacterium]|nr:DCC1-like thiol-disulfide oxidoreductase family protein [Pseudomonadota bacterium]